MALTHHTTRGAKRTPILSKADKELIAERVKNRPPQTKGFRRALLLRWQQDGLITKDEALELAQLNKWYEWSTVHQPLLRTAVVQASDKGEAIERALEQCLTDWHFRGKVESVKELTGERWYITLTVKRWDRPVQPVW